MVINFLRLDHSEIIIKKFNLAHHKENENQFHRLQGRRLFPQEMTNKIEAQFQCRHLQEGRRLNSMIPVDFPQNSFVGQQGQRISELQFDKFPNPHFFALKIRFKNQVTTCVDFPSDALLWIKEVEMVDSLDEIEVLAISLWKEFSKLRDAGCDDCLCSEQDHPEFPFQEEGEPRGTESPKRRPVSTRKTDRLHDLRLLSSDWRS